MKTRNILGIFMLTTLTMAMPGFAAISHTETAQAASAQTARDLHQQITSPTYGYFSPKEQFNSASATVSSPVGGYTANGFMSPSGQTMTSPQGSISQPMP